MFGKALKGLFGSVKAKPTSLFSFLDQTSFGAARRAEEYLINGAANGILAELDALQIPHPRLDRDVNTALQNLPRNMGGQPERLARYVQLRHAMKWGLPRRFREDQHLTNTPEIIRNLFALTARTYGHKPDNPTTPHDIIAATRLLGGTDVDVIVHLLPGRYGTSFVPPEGFWDNVDPAHYIQAIERCDAQGKASSIESHKALPVMKTPKMAEYLFQQFEATSSKVREAARLVLETQDPQMVEAKAVELLQAGKANSRTMAVQLLGAYGTPTALEALKARREKEKSQAVLTALDAVLNTSAITAELDEVENGYIDVTGAHVTLPSHELLVDDGGSPLDEAFFKQLQEIEKVIDEEQQLGYESRLVYWRKSTNPNRGDKPKPPETKYIAKTWFDALNTPVTPDARPQLPSFTYRHQQNAYAVIESVLDQVPMRRLIDLTVSHRKGLPVLIGRQTRGIGAHIQSAITDGRLSLKQVFDAVEDQDKSRQTPDDHEPDPRPNTLIYLEALLGTSADRRYARSFPGVWEIATPHLQSVIEALPPRNTDIHVNLRALRVAADFPTLPEALRPAVLFCAIDARPKLHGPAQELLRDVEGIDDELVTLLKDKRQAVRANAARFLADRGSAKAATAIAKRLKTEKSEMAKADMISGLAALGGDTSPYLGKEPLLKEARTLVDKLPNEKIKWLELSSAPALHWADGSTADPVLADAWLRLALKLKSPLGTPLFGLYFKQLTPDSAQAFADWVLDAWMSYDVAKPSNDDVRRRAVEQARKIMSMPNHWMARNRTEDEIVQSLMMGMSKEYINSGADSKGILALTHGATPTQAGPRIAAHLKKHGKRVAQAKSLVEVLYAMGTRDAIQVLVATATRFRQRTVRELASTLVGELAEARGWTEEELADRSIPSGGFEEDGTLPLPVGEEEKAYVARLDSDLTVRLFNPAGKEVKSIPAGKDENTKESKALLSAAKKTVKAAAEQQQARLYEAMLTPRDWEAEAWQDDLATHPIMRRLVERLIWRGLDADSAPLKTFRMTAEGDVMDADGDDVDLSDVAKIDMAHTANIAEETRDAWLQHLKDFEVDPLFPQVSRPVRTLTEEMASSTKLEDRQGWLTTNFKLRGAAKKCGYERGPIGDGGGYDAYRKEFRGAGLNADLHFTGSYMGAEDFAAAIDFMQFTKTESNAWSAQPVVLKQVPPLLLSEVWNDLHEIAKVGEFDPDWKKKGLY